MIKRVLVLAAALCGAAAAHAATNLLVDGSFEGESVPAGDYGMYPGTSFYGWTAGPAAPLELRDDVVGTAEDGVNFVELDSTANTTLSQAFATTAGQSYTLSFWYSNRPQNDAYNGVFPGGVVPVSSQGLSYDVGTGAVTLPALAVNTGTDNLWSEYTTTFVATGASTTLTFAALGTSDSYGSSLDNVSVTTAVPEPASFALMAAGGLGLLGMVRRRHGRR